MANMFMKVHEAADELQVSRYSIYQLMWAGEVQSVKVGRSRRIIRKSFDDYVAGLIEMAA